MTTGDRAHAPFPLKPDVLAAAVAKVGDLPCVGTALTEWLSQ